jgi:hypothetical protein
MILFWEKYTNNEEKYENPSHKIEIILQRENSKSKRNGKYPLACDRCSRFFRQQCLFSIVGAR